MNIQESLKTLIAQRNFERTPRGRPVTEKALHTLNATIADEKNYEVEVIKCLNCCIMLSSILVTKECPNCGSIDLSTNI
jgi:hypothetical protein